MDSQSDYRDNPTAMNDDNKVNKMFKTEFDAKYKIIDVQTPKNAYMSGQYKRSYAYYTLRSRLPVILTNVIDTMTKEKTELITEYGENSREELKIIIGLISRLKYELQTDKPFEYFTGHESDRDIWNNFLSRLPEQERTFYKACWLHAECYMYRKLFSFVENSIFLNNFDYFAKIKRNALKCCMDDVLLLAEDTRRTENTFEAFSELLKIDLWSNRNDLSAINGERFNKKVLNDVGSLDSSILVNMAAGIWKCLQNRNSQKHQVDFILDNAGYELFADFILAEYIIEKGLASKVRFHVKAHPWFVSDITETDFHWTLQYLSSHSDYIVSLIGNKFLQFLDERKFEIAPISNFWTTPHAFHSMIDVAPELYQSLQQSKLIIFKGDLNYRKLLNDVCWDATEDIRTCLNGFLPTDFCTVRTVKAEVICGLPEGMSDDLGKKDPQWMVTGNYGIIQYVDAEREFGY